MNTLDIKSTFEIPGTSKYETEEPPPCPRGHTEGAHHDCGYVDAVNRLIPGAEADAIARMEAHFDEFGPPEDESESDELFAYLFHEEMQIACEGAGLRKPGPPHE